MRLSAQQPAVVEVAVWPPDEIAVEAVFFSDGTILVTDDSGDWLAAGGSAGQQTYSDLADRAFGLSNPAPPPLRPMTEDEQARFVRNVGA